MCSTENTQDMIAKISNQKIAFKGIFANQWRRGYWVNLEVIGGSVVSALGMSDYRGEEATDTLKFTWDLFYEFLELVWFKSFHAKKDITPVC